MSSATRRFPLAQGVSSARGFHALNLNESTTLHTPEGPRQNVNLLPDMSSQPDSIHSQIVSQRQWPLSAFRGQTFG